MCCSAADLWLRRVSCDGDDPPRPREEYTGEDKVIFVLRGRFVLRNRLTKAVASPRTAVALRAGDAYTIEHPHGEGDVCLSIARTRLSRRRAMSKLFRCNPCRRLLLCDLLTKEDKEKDYEIAKVVI